MTVRLLVLGAGGFARETLDVVHALEQAAPGGIRVVGVVDDAPSQETVALLTQRETDVVGTVEQFVEDALDVEYDEYVIAIGDPGVRLSLASRAPRGAVLSRPLVHPRSSTGTRTSLGAGTIVCAGAVISTNVVMGRHGHVNPNATVGHDVRFGTAVSVNPGAVVSGAVTVGDGVLIGAGSVVLQGLTVGAGSVVGAAACVTRDVRAGAVVVGVPAR